MRYEREKELAEREAMKYVKTQYAELLTWLDFKIKSVQTDLEFYRQLRYGVLEKVKLEEEMSKERNLGYGIE